MGTAIAAHLIDLLTATGLSARDAVLVGSLIGPMQVAGRIMEFAFGRHLRALAVGTLAFTLMAASLALFTQVRGVWIVALAFAMIYGWSNGVMTIVRGRSRRSCSATAAMARCSAASRGRNSSSSPARRWRSRCYTRSIRTGR